MLTPPQSIDLRLLFSMLHAYNTMRRRRKRCEAYIAAAAGEIFDADVHATML